MESTPLDIERWELSGKPTQTAARGRGSHVLSSDPQRLSEMQKLTGPQLGWYKRGTQGTTLKEALPIRAMQATPGTSSPRPRPSPKAHPDLSQNAF